jgi:hypothetical protein
MISHLCSGRSLLSWGFLGDTGWLASLGSSGLLWSPLRTSIGLGTLLGGCSRWLREGWEDSGSGVPYMYLVQLSPATLRAEYPDNCNMEHEGCMQYGPVAERVPSRAMVFCKRISIKRRCRGGGSVGA